MQDESRLIASQLKVKAENLLFVEENVDLLHYCGWSLDATPTLQIDDQPISLKDYMVLGSNKKWFLICTHLKVIVMHKSHLFAFTYTMVRK